MHPEKVSQRSNSCTEDRKECGVLSGMLSDLTEHSFPLPSCCILETVVIKTSLPCASQGSFADSESVKFVVVLMCRCLFSGDAGTVKPSEVSARECSLPG